MARKCLPIDNGRATDDNPLRTIFIPLALDDPVLFQSTMNFAAVHLDTLHSRPNQVKTLIMKAKTIRMINEQLKNDKHAPSNSSIGTIVFLAAMEVSVHFGLSLISNFVRLLGTSSLNATNTY